MEIISCPKAMQRFALESKRQGNKIGFVPTMGALHEGHLSLVKLASTHSECVAASIFVNPKQFNDPKDLEKYPRCLEADAEMLGECGVQVLFAPEPKDMYGASFQTTVNISRIAAPLEGAHRPGHFEGVATVVSLLFNIVQPDCAVFGEKDFQQLRVIETLVDDLKFPIQIIRGPTCREANGLAMSSRNARLSPEGREAAKVLNDSMLMAARDMGANRNLNLADLSRRVAQLISRAGLEVEYTEIVDEETLLPPAIDDARLRLLVAARIEGVRLIDNMRLG